MNLFGCLLTITYRFCQMTKVAQHLEKTSNILVAEGLQKEPYFQNTIYNIEFLAYIMNQHTMGLG